MKIISLIFLAILCIDYLTYDKRVLKVTGSNKVEALIKFPLIAKIHCEELCSHGGHNQCEFFRGRGSRSGSPEYWAACKEILEDAIDAGLPMPK